MLEKLFNIFKTHNVGTSSESVVEDDWRSSDPIYIYSESKSEIITDVTTYPHPSLRDSLGNDDVTTSDIVVLWWLDNPRTNKSNIPKYFLEYYGVILLDHIANLQLSKLVSDDWQVTDHAKVLLKKHANVIANHRAGIYLSPDYNDKMLKKRYELDVNFAMYCLNAPKRYQLEQSYLDYFEQSNPNIIHDAKKRLDH